MARETPENQEHFWTVDMCRCAVMILEITLDIIYDFPIGPPPESILQELETATLQLAAKGFEFERDWALSYNNLDNEEERRLFFEKDGSERQLADFLIGYSMNTLRLHGWDMKAFKKFDDEHELP